MTCYLQLTPEGETRCLWDISRGEAVRLGVTNPKQGPGTYFKTVPGQTIWQAMKAGAGGWFEPPSDRFFPIHLKPGEYYPRLCRPSADSPMDATGISPSAWEDQATVAIARGQLSALVRRLEDLCQVIHPDGSNLKAYGHDIRSLLLLACTEVESHWRGVLVANGFISSYFSTKDYILLSGPMRLREYGVAFHNFPWLEEIRPFALWKRSGPTKSLPWYDAYNATKHDREGQFSAATLQHCFSAVAACVVMTVAQFTADGALGNGELRSSVSPTTLPRWHPSQTYVYPGYGPGRAWAQKLFPFKTPPALTRSAPQP